MRTVYAVQFGVDSTTGGSSTDVLEQLKSRCSAWIASKYRRAWAMDVAPAFDGCIHRPLDGHSLRCQHEQMDDSELVVIDWSHPHDHDTSSTWVNGVTLARRGETVELAILIRVATTQMVIRPVGITLGRPRLLTDILSDYRISRGGAALPNAVHRVATADTEAFVESVLLSPTRAEPVILISPDSWTERPRVDPSTVFDYTREFARVAVLDTKWAAFKLTDSLERELSCFDGAVRLYWPGFTRTSSPFDHRLYLKDTFRPGAEVFARGLFRFLASISAFRFVEGPTTRAVRKTIADGQREDLQRLREAAQSGVTAKAELEEKLLEALVKIETLEEERDRLAGDLEAQKSAWAEFQTYSAVSSDVGGSDAATATSPVADGYATVAEAFAAAKKQFSGPLLFLDSAEQAADKSPYKNQERVYELFAALHLVASEWREKDGDLGQTWNGAMRDLGFDFRDQISATTKGKWAADYEFQYKGQARLFEKHITMGAKQADKCLSVHVYRDDDDLVLVVGHCGRHLTNTKA